MLCLLALLAIVLALGKALPSRERDPGLPRLEDHHEGRRRAGSSMRLFGHNVEVPSSRPTQRRSSLRDRTRVPRVFGIDLDPFASLAIGETTHERHDPYTSSLAQHGSEEAAVMTPAERQASMEKAFKKYRFGVLDPDLQTIQPVSIFRGHGAEYYIGNEHEHNGMLIQQRIDERWPPGIALNAEEQYKKDMTLKTVQVARQAMRYLLKSETNGVIHEASGKVYLNPGAAGSTREGPIKEVYEQYGQGNLPKLRYTSARAHFKQSLMKKIARRKPWMLMSDQDEDDAKLKRLSKNTLEEETSSEEEEKDQEQTSTRRRKPFAEEEAVVDDTSTSVRRRGRAKD